MTMDGKMYKANTNNNIGYSYIQLEDFDNALIHLNKAISIKSDQGGYYNNRGYAYLMMGKEREALMDYYKALRYNPRFPKAYENLIGYYLSKDDTVRARGILDDALAAEVQSPGITYFKAVFENMDGHRHDCGRRLTAQEALSPPLIACHHASSDG